LLSNVQRLLPFWLVLAAFAAGRAPIMWALALLLASAASLLTPRPEKLSTFGELVVCLLVLAVPVMWSKGQEDLSPAISFTLVVLCTFAARSFLQMPLLGAAADRVLVLAAAVAIGLGLRSAAYPLLMTACSFTLFGGAKREGPRRHIERSTWFALGLAALSLGALLLLFPWLNNATNRRFSHYLQGRGSQTGFSPTVRLDGAGSIETSDAIALRVHARGGANIDGLDYLRGSVLDRFDGSAWSASSLSIREGETSHGPRVGTPTGPFADVQSEHRAPYVFAPLGSSVWSIHRLSADAFGVWRAGGLGIDHWALLDTHGRDNDRNYDRERSGANMNAQPPTAADLELPAALVPQLRALAQSWTEGAANDSERIERLTAKLRQFEYSLDRGAGPKRTGNPLLHFLLVSQKGHCEFFASSLIALARTLEIPARMVTGFRVVERNGYGHYAVVRARHAHAWAEVYDGARWQTIDATPASVSRPASDSRGVRSLLDHLGVQAQRAYDLALATPERTLPVLVVIVVTGLLLRYFLLRRRKRASAAQHESAPQAFIDFSAKLASLGFTRAPDETLRAFAERLQAASQGAYAQQLLRYAAARYNPKAGDDAWRHALIEITKE
jgi:transglutaminase-like putative cysteine protease